MPLRRIALLLVFGSFLLAEAQVDNKASGYHPQKGSEILWDKFGVPHIYGKTVGDMFFLFGYAETEAHGDLMLHTIGGSRGRGAEYFGAGDGGECGTVVDEC